MGILDSRRKSVRILADQEAYFFSRQRFFVDFLKKGAAQCVGRASPRF
jgi:hypothetical protein